MAKYIWQSASWPKFKIDYESLLPKLSRCHALQGQLIQQVTSLGIDLQLAAQLESLTQEAVKTAAIEGEHYNPDAVRFSIARRLGLPTAGLPSPPRSVDGLVDVLLDATDTNRPDLSSDRLKAWQAALFPTGRSGLYEIEVGQWRTETMQIVSGPAGKEKIHYEAPPADRIDHEMQLFVEWWQKVTRIKTIQILSSELGSPTIGLWQFIPLLMEMDELHGRSQIWRLLNQAVRQNAATASLQSSWKAGTDIMRCWKALQMDREISQVGWLGFQTDLNCP